jgi:hypothetical protein
MVVGLQGILAIIAFLFTMRMTSKSPAAKWGGWKSIKAFVQTADFWGWMLFVIFAICTSVISFAISYGGWDSITIWSIKGYGIAHEGSIFATREYGDLGSYYPMNIQIGIALFSIVGGDAFPLSKFIFSLFFISLLLVIRAYFYRSRMPSLLAWGMIFLIATVPYLLEYALRGYANVPFAFYIVAGILWVAAGLASEQPRKIALGGALLAFSAWTRVEGIQFWLIIFFVFILFGGHTARRLRSILRFVIPIFLVYLPWYIFSKLHPNPTIVSNLVGVALQQVLAGHINWLAFYQIPKYILWRMVKSEQVWGLFIPAGSVYAAIAYVVKKDFRRNVLIRFPFMSAIGYVLGVIAMYYITSYDESNSLDFWLGTGADRMLIPGIVLFGVSSALILSMLILPKMFPGKEPIETTPG